MDKVILFFVGAVTLAVCGIFWIYFSDFEETGMVYVPVMIITSSILAYFYKMSRMDVVCFVLGACVSLTIVIFIIGPGNIWPIALVINYFTLMASGIIGHGIGEQLKRKFQKNVKET